jgi:Cdc6-like AAA superfamily ATPase
MQYEYGIQEQGVVTSNWHFIKDNPIQEGDYLFLRGKEKIYAVGKIIKPRKKADIMSEMSSIIENKTHGVYSSKQYDGCIHFSDQPVFYEDLSEVVYEEQRWGQLIDVDSWMYFDPQGIDAKSKGYYAEGSNEFNVMKELKEDAALYFIKTLKHKFMGEELKLLESNKNLILTGAPGTGKTYLAQEIARKLLFDKENEDLLSDKEKEEFKERCRFVQFHPSYDYTDFVEGLRPIQDDDGNVGFELKSGVFKQFCEDAKKFQNIDAGGTDNFDDAWNTLINQIRDKLPELTKIGNYEYGLSRKETLKYSSQDTPSQYTFTITRDNVYSAYKKQQARNSGAFQKDMNDVVNYMKERCKLSNYKESTTSETNHKKFIFIIDEINRGEISKIFGELFFSIDPGYRGEKGKVKTQYANMHTNEEEFYVPDNVYIIGTMNDIDRSVESFDFAMRRRFTWVEITAKKSQKMLNESWKTEAITRMDSLNNAILKIEGLNSSYHIGAAYFKNNLPKYNENEQFQKLWEYHLAPLLKEYLRGMSDANKYLDDNNKGVLFDAYELKNDNDKKQTDVSDMGQQSE